MNRHNVTNGKEDSNWSNAARWKHLKSRIAKKLPVTAEGAKFAVIFLSSHL